MTDTEPTVYGSANWIDELTAYGGVEKLHPALQPWLTDGPLGLMVKHPFVYVQIGPNGLLTKYANDAYDWKRKVRREYLDERNWNGYLMAHERPYRMYALGKLWDRGRLGLDEMRELLADMWTDTEMPQSNQAEPLHLFREAEFTTDDPDGWAKLKDKKSIRLYRGVDYKFELTKDGPSWTTDRSVADFFAKRYNADGDVFRYDAHPDEVLAWLGGRGESEAILDFDGESDRERIKHVA